MHWIDHHFLPDIGGTVERFILNRHGEVDGLVLMYDAERFLFVHVPPHLGPELTSAAAPGDAVRVRGIRPRGGDMVAAVAVIASNGDVIVDNGPNGKNAQAPQPPPHEKVDKIELDGVVRMSLFGPKGELRGALLNNGDIVRVGPKEAIQVADLLRPGATLSVRGEGLDTRYGRIVCAAEIGPDPARLRRAKEDVREPKPEKRPDASPAQHAAIGAE